MKILVTGANGQLGSEVRDLSTNYPYDFEFIDLNELDLTKTGEITPFLQRSDPDFIINCAAYTAVDKAEDEPAVANIINAQVPGIIAEYSQQNNARLIHISTDYVFDTNIAEPIGENMTPDPQSVYGKTKWSGEKAINGFLKNAYIIRTSWVYSSFGNNFVKTMIRLGQEREEISVVDDQYGTPTYARDLAEAIFTIVGQVINGHDVPGTYHFSNEGSGSWYDFAVRIMELAAVNCRVKPIPTSSYPTKAKRPSYSVLNKAKIKATFAPNIPHWTESLDACLEKYLNDSV